jgi:hypothetical protein
VGGRGRTSLLLLMVPCFVGLDPGFSGGGGIELALNEWRCLGFVEVPGMQRMVN